MKNQGFILRKGIIIEVISPVEFKAEDVLNKEIFTVTISGKLRIDYFKVNLGDELFAEVLPHNMSRGRIATETSFKGNNGLFKQKIQIDKKQKE